MFTGKSGLSRNSGPSGKPVTSSDDALPLAQRRELARSCTIAKMAALPVLDDLSWPGIRSVAAFRILAICSRAGRDPLTELGRRFRSLPAARSFMDLADMIGRYWPENVSVCRPCSRVLSPDEATLCDMVDCARNGDRDAFRRVLDGLVRSERHEALFAATTRAVAHMDMSDWQGCRGSN